MPHSSKLLKTWLSMLGDEIAKLEKELEEKRGRYAAWEKELARLTAAEQTRKQSVKSKVQAARAKPRQGAD